MKVKKTLPRQGKRFGFHSIQIKLVAAYTLVIVAVLILLNTYPVLMTQDMIFHSKEDNLKSQLQVISNTLPVSDKLTKEGVEQTLSLLEDLSYDRIIVTDEAGLVLYDTEKESLYGYYILEKSIVSVLRGNDVFVGEYKVGEDKNGVFESTAASPIMSRDSIIGAVYLYESDDVQGGLLRDIQNNLWMISVTICVVVFVISLFLTRIFTSRIDGLLSAIRVVREGEYTHRIQVKGKDELSQLGEEFNELTGRFQVTEEARRRFVSDASHELKTPLASIKLLVDSILHGNMKQETVNEFLGDIGEAVDRLSGISENLLTLNRLDAGQKHPSEPVDLSFVVDKTRHLLGPLAQAADVTIETVLKRESMVFASEGALAQVISNLMENAIKYNVPRGWVKVSVYQAEKQVVLTVEDSGVGIPEEDIPHIFERFYRVDKARSRDAGGTGLGLSIVWETVRLYHGDISIAARKGGGVRIMVTFPRWKEGGLA